MSASSISCQVRNHFIDLRSTGLMKFEARNYRVSDKAQRPRLPADALDRRDQEVKELLDSRLKNLPTRATSQLFLSTFQPTRSAGAA